MKFLALAFLMLIAFLPLRLLAQEGESSLAPIVVSSELERQKSSQLLAPGSFTIKDSEEINKSQAQSLDDILRNEPGVEFTGGPRPSAELPQIRGFGASRILVLEDGARQNFQSGHNGRVFTDASFLESVEVVKGPWSALYGSGALGGVLSLQRPTARSYLRRTGGDPGAEIRGDFSSASTATGGRLTAFGKVGAFEPLVSVRQERFEDLRTGGGERLRYSAGDFRDTYSSMGWDWGFGQMTTVRVSESVEEAVLPLNPNTANTSPADTGDTRIKKQDVIVGHQWKAGELLDLNANLYARTSEVRKERTSDGRSDVQKVQTTGVDAWNHFSGRLSENWDTITTLGVEYFEDVQRGLREDGPLESFPDGKASQAGVSLQPQFIWNKSTKFAPGLRYDSYRTSSESEIGVDNRGDELTGKFYALHEYAAGHSVFAGYSQGFNAPRMQDLYATGVHFTMGPTANFFIPNPDLKPERTESVEIGTKSRTILHGGLWRWDLEATLFQTKARDFIERNVLPPPTNTTQFVNVPHAELYGAEFETLLRTMDWGTGFGYSQIRGRNTETKGALADLPAAKWTLRLETYFGADQNYTLGTDLQYAERQADVPTGRGTGVDPSAPYFAEDVYFSFSNPGRGGSFGVRVNNMYDRMYRRNGSLLNEAGRDYRLQASWLF